MTNKKYTNQKYLHPLSSYKYNTICNIHKKRGNYHAFLEGGKLALDTTKTNQHPTQPVVITNTYNTEQSHYKKPSI